MNSQFAQKKVKRQETRTLLQPEPVEQFIETNYVRGLTERAMCYVQAGYPVHFRGPAGTGKTTMAKHLAAKIGRPVVLLHGDETLTSESLLGGEYGYHSRKVVDNFISSVLKEEEEFARHWVDNRLTTACRYGFTLIYDEFTRSRPEANNALLSILEDRMIYLPASSGQDPYLKVHPDFTAIFTSNPEEYAGVYRSQDALRDRMVTVDLDFFDFETEAEITESRSGVEPAVADLIVNIVHALRETNVCEFPPTVRGCLMIAKTVQVSGKQPLDDPYFFRSICQDVLASETNRTGSDGSRKKVKHIVGELVDTLLPQIGSKTIQQIAS